MDNDSVTSLCVSGNLTVAHSLGTDLETGTILSCHHIFFGIADFKNKSTSSSSICCLTWILPKCLISIVKWLVNSRTARFFGISYYILLLCALCLTSCVEWNRVISQGSTSEKLQSKTSNSCIFVLCSLA